MTYFADGTIFKKRTVEPSGNPAVYKNEVYIYKRASAFPRAYIVHKAIFQPNVKAAFDILKKLQTHLRDFAVINAQPVNDIAERLLAIPPEIKSSATVKRYGTNDVAVEADLKAPGFLILADAYHPDWKVLVGGKEDKIYLANNLMRAVYLPEGKHEVRFTFEPVWFKTGLILGLLCLSAVIAMLLPFRAGKRP